MYFNLVFFVFPKLDGNFDSCDTSTNSTACEDRDLKKLHVHRADRVSYIHCVRPADAGAGPSRKTPSGHGRGCRHGRDSAKHIGPEETNHMGSQPA